MDKFEDQCFEDQCFERQPSDEGLTFETSVFELLQWLIYLIDLVVDNFTLVFYFPTDTAHSLFRN